MNIHPWPLISLLACLATTGGGCGVVVGNPDDPEEEEKAFVPTLDFEIPAAVTGRYSLLQADTVLYKWANRTDRIIDDLNSLLDRLNRDKVKERGSFSGKGVDGLLSGTIDSGSFGDYSYQGVLCYDGTPFQLVRWNEDRNSVYAIRDFGAVSVRQDNRSAFITEITYKKGASTTVDLAIQGVPWVIPEDVSDGSNLIESISATKSDSGSFSFKGVNNWYPDDGDPRSEADGYLVGAFDGEGKGEFVGYEKHKSERCPDAFQETNSSDPGWCLGREIGGEKYGDEARLAAWGRLQTIGISTRANLRTIVMPALSCP